ncbi:MAG: tetratricopeptide repeat protein, partial [Methanothrix sp.]|nr:tetratricopeptide repeat protein [Methanothrix sp.]
IAPMQCQLTANSGTISGFDLDNSADYNKALNTALNFYNQCKYDEAINAYDVAIRLDPVSTQTWQAWNGKGDALYGLGKFDEAVLAYDKAIGLWPDNAIPWAYKADALKALGRINDSEAAYARAKELGFGGSTWRPKAITLNGSPIAAPETTATMSIDEGLKLNNQGRYDEAIRAFDAAIKLDPYNADIWKAWSGKAVALKALGLTEEAEAANSGAEEMRSLLNTSTSSTVDPVNHILDHSMASIVDESTNIPITRTSKFTNADQKAYSWLSLANVASGRVEWYWYSPDGNLYKTGSVEIPPNPNGGYWPSYNIWYYIDIADIPVEPYLSGKWNVNVYLVGPTYVTQLNEQFDLDNGLLPQKTSPILDHCMANNVDEDTRKPITRTEKFFLATDSKIYSWISLGNVGPASFYWYWYSPDGSSYRVGPIDVPPNPSGGYWPTYNLWASIDARTLYAEAWDLELPSDEFHVDVIRNDRQILTEYFTVNE